MDNKHLITANQSTVVNLHKNITRVYGRQSSRPKVNTKIIVAYYLFLKFNSSTPLQATPLQAKLLFSLGLVLFACSGCAPTHTASNSSIPHPGAGFFLDDCY